MPANSLVFHGLSNRFGIDEIVLIRFNDNFTNSVRNSAVIRHWQLICRGELSRYRELTSESAEAQLLK
jgi:hypothetical protein